MSAKIITALTAAILLGSTALASAQSQYYPRYRGDGYYGPGISDYQALGFGVAPGYYGRGIYGYAPGNDGYFDYRNNPWGAGW
jgi:hypothetical protein